MSSRVPLHRLYSHYSELPASLRVMYTATLLIFAFGYLFSLVYVFNTQAGKDGKAMLSYDDVVISYSGNGKGSRLEAALRGPMQSMLPPEEMQGLVAWVRGGAKKDAYENDIKAVLDKRCMSCHDGASNPHLSSLATYDAVKKLAEVDTGTSVATLVRVSHIHLFGLTFIFFIVGTIFSHAYLRPVWLKCVAIGVPFACIAADVSSWYFTKLFHPFAWVVMGAGALMAASFAFMWAVSLWQMWIGAVPEAVRNRSVGGQDVG